MNIAIYGGSFNPTTLGHQMVVAHLILNEPDIEEIWIIPCNFQNGKMLLDFNHRFEMCMLNFGVFNRVKVSDVEYRLGGESFTYRTLQTLQMENPDHNFRFVIGSDLQESIKTWEGHDVIEKIAPPLIVGRAGIPSPAGGPTPISPIVSSTMVRDALRHRNYKDAERYLSAPVLSYIQKWKLYLEG